MSRSPFTPYTPAIGLLLGLALACAGVGSGDVGSGDSYRSSSYREPAPGAEGYTTLDHSFRVPPDRALVAVTVGVSQPSFAETSAALSAEVANIQAALTGPCTTTLMDASSPDQDGTTWSASAELRVDIDLRGLPGVAERRTRLDTCLAALDPLLTTEWKKISVGTRIVQRSAPLLSVDDPEQHRDALLAQAAASLAWAAGAAGAPQLHPTDLRCVPRGTVTVGDRRLSGVVLELDLPCRVYLPEEDDAPAPAIE